MNVNEALFDEISPYLHEYDCDFVKIKHFLENRHPFLQRQSEAISIIEGIMTAHGKKELLKHVAELARVEYGIRELEPWVRDHVVHAVLSFILGIYLNEKFFEVLNGAPIDKFQWKIAGLLHDVGYPVQVAKDILNPYSSKINEIKRNLGVPAPDIDFKIIPSGLNNLTNRRDSLNLIQDCLINWGLQIDARGEYEHMIASGNICHGIMSALSILYIIDLMYQKYNHQREYSDIYAVSSDINWNQKYFERDVVSACSAIYIHNLPSRCFTNAKIDFSKAPLAFLLKLSDCLQEWERPSHLNQNGYPSSLFDVKIENSQLILRANIPDDNKEKIKREVSLFLNRPNVQII